jgi:hypothetical protein
MVLFLAAREGALRGARCVAAKLARRGNESEWRPAALNRGLLSFIALIL